MASAISVTTIDRNQLRLGKALNMSNERSYSYPASSRATIDVLLFLVDVWTDKLWRLLGSLASMLDTVGVVPTSSVYLTLRRKWRKKRRGGWRILVNVVEMALDTPLHATGQSLYRM
jgi:hypothetical protein